MRAMRPHPLHTGEPGCCSCALENLWGGAINDTRVGPCPATAEGIQRCGHIIVECPVSVLTQWWHGDNRAANFFRARRFRQLWHCTCAWLGDRDAFAPRARSSSPEGALLQTKHSLLVDGLRSWAFENCARGSSLVQPLHIGIWN